MAQRVVIRKKLLGGGVGDPLPLSVLIVFRALWLHTALHYLNTWNRLTHTYICVILSSMWNCFAIQWGFTCESLCETPCDVYVKMCVKGMIVLHTLSTYISLCKISHACEICVWNACERWVKMCEKSVKIGAFSRHVFHIMFHIYTPSSVQCTYTFISTRCHRPTCNSHTVI